MPFCPECGKPVGATARFCRNCGASQAEDAKPEQPVTVPVPPPPPAAFSATPPPPPPQATPTPSQPGDVRTCRACGNVIRPGDKYCSKCLVMVKEPDVSGDSPSPAATHQEDVSPPVQAGTVRTCRACGNVIRPGDKYCSKCLVMVREPGPAPAVPATSPPPAPVPATATPAPEAPSGGYVCASCKSPLSGTEKFCGTCGGPAVAVRVDSEPAQPEQNRTCPACGTSLSDTAKFCGGCGKPVNP